MTTDPMNTRAHPIDAIRWVDPQVLTANDYNPNAVADTEMRLLEFSLRKQGWLQPILVTDRMVIIDGFHRWAIARAHGWKIPVAVLKISEPERMLLTIRINRAKGSHVAFDMSKIIKTLMSTYNYTKKQIQEGIGAGSEEINLLMQENVFTKLDIKAHKYTQAWIPK